MKKLKVATVQFRHSEGDKRRNLSCIQDFAFKAKDRGVDILVCPEMCITGYWHVSRLEQHQVEALAETVPSGDSCQALIAMSKANNISIGAGLIEKGDDGALYNSYVFAMPSGEVQVHRKLHTFVSPYMSSGSEYTVFDTPYGWKIGILICWDNNLVENVRITALKGADLLLTPHQTGGCDSRSPDAMGKISLDVWKNRHRNPQALKEEMQGPKGREWLMRWLPARAHDNGLFLVFSNGVGRDMDEVRTGNAMILDPYGQVMAESDSIENDMVVATLDPKRLKMCTGRRWIRGRRPELYGILSQAKGTELSPLDARFSEEEI